MKLSSLFDNYKKLTGVFQTEEKKTFKKLIAISFLSIVIELLGLFVIYLLIILILDRDSGLRKIQELIDYPTLNYAWILGVLLLGFLTKSILSVFVHRWQLQKLFIISGNLAARVFDQSFEFGLADHKKVSTSERLNNVTTIGNSFPFIVLLPAITVISEIGILVITMSVLVSLKPFLVLILTLGLVPQTALILFLSKRKLDSAGKQVTDKYAIQNELIADSVQGYSEINLFDLSHLFKSRNKILQSNIYKDRLKIQIFGSALPVRLMELATIGGLCILSIYLYNNNDYQGVLGTLALFAASAFRILPSLNRIVGSANSFNTYIDIVDSIPTQSVSISKEHQQEISNFESLQIKDLTFGFDSETGLFNQLSLQINRGDFIGIYGPSGTGKTTLINFILGFYDVEKGSILINNIRISEVKMSWQRKLGYVKQDAFMLSKSILENVAFGDENPNKGRVVELLKKVNLERWIESLSNGVETSIGDHGTLISGGQKQRIAIARALYRNAEILICDEITNSLDESNMRDIWNIIDELNKSGTTIIMISHDLKAFEKANKIYEIKGGKLLGK